jgi:hypothetical protein
VPLALRLAPSGRGRQHGQKRQRPALPREGNRRHDGQRQPTQTAGFHKHPSRRPNRVTVDSSGLDLGSPAPLDRVVDRDDDLAAWAERREQVHQQPARHLARIPARSAERLVVATEPRLVRQAHDAQGLGDGALARRQNGAGDQHQNAAPDGRGEARPKHGQPGRQDRWRLGNDGRDRGENQAHRSRRIESPPSRKSLAKANRIDTRRRTYE